ncbi:phosphatidic acid phosphatase type 2/haloperoxidase [Cercophora newfieldiana]|uniref:Phosphatidic acid phosphatase type 2/haloperoxidase n=1 Tax=Cercophora newfieldiana TaxID=92897 RepID=A0AA39YC97_9PEZI|nr:phosphatidic acid phosphatase type 2/haloperoxidase [Cercophora newfieldiana]
MLPLHRRDRGPRQHGSAAEVNEKWHATANDSKPKRLGAFFVRWVKESWKDILTIIVLGIASQLIYKAPLKTTRTFPVTFTESGDIVWPELAFPERGWIISPALSGILATLVPIAVIIVAQIRIRSFWDANNGVLGVLYSVILGTIFQVIIKIWAGGFRPYFLTVCQPDISLAAGRNITGLNGVGFRQVMYTVDICTNPDKGTLKNAMTSFPSGHATVAFAGYVFLFLWMNAKLKVWSNSQTSFYWLALLAVPLLGAVLMAIALSISQDHHWYDILAGCIIGSLAAFASYRILYAAVFDWRYNHIPLKRREALDYTAWSTPHYLERAVFVKKLGWGRRRVGGRSFREKRLSKGAHSTWSEGSPANARAATPIRQSRSPRRPEAAMPRDGLPRRGDEMV